MYKTRSLWYYSTGATFGDTLRHRVLYWKFQPQETSPFQIPQYLWRPYAAYKRISLQNLGANSQNINFFDIFLFFSFFFNQPTTWQINGIQIFLSVAQGLQGGWVVLSGSTVSAIPNHLLHLRLSLFCLDISLPFGCFSILPKLSNVSTLYLLLQKAFSYTCNTVLFRCRSFRSVCKTRSAEFLGRNRRNLDQTPSITHPLLH